MQFRVAAVQDTDLPEELTDVRLFLEELLNRAIGDADFGWPLGCVMVVMFMTTSLPKAPAASRLVGIRSDAPTLALHVVLDPEAVMQTPAASLLPAVSAAVSKGLPVQPVRVPKGLDYQRLRRAVVAVVEPYVSAVQPFAAADGFAAR